MKTVTLLLLAAYALSAAEKVPLSLKQAVEIALAPDGNSRVRLAALAIEQSKTRVAQARGALLPNIDGGVSGQNFTRNLRAFGFSFPANIPGLSLPNVVGPITNFDARLSANLTVFDFAAWKRLDTAKTGVAVAQAEAESQRNLVAEAVARAYVGALRSTAALQVAQANLTLAESLRKLALDQKEAGSGTGIEVLRADVQIANERQRQSLLANEQRRAHLHGIARRHRNLAAGDPEQVLSPGDVSQSDQPAVMVRNQDAHEVRVTFEQRAQRVRVMRQRL